MKYGATGCKVGKREGQNTWGPDWLGGPEILVKCLHGHWCDCQEGWGSVMCNHLLVLGPPTLAPALTGCIAHSSIKIRMVYIYKLAQ